jgi:transcriptional regulator with XRE-family HTH domain
MDSIGQKIKNAREVKKFSQDFVAKKLGITQRAYSKIENNEVNLSVSRLLKISEILCIQANELLPNDTALVYNNNFTTQKGNGVLINQTEKSLELYEKLIHEKDNLISAKDEIITYLKSKLK